MKKIFTILSLIAVIGISSCKQDWVCQCTDANSNVTNTPINGGTFLHAEHDCNHMSGKCSLITLDRQ
jgi:hypothetical protein